MSKEQLTALPKVASVLFAPRESSESELFSVVTIAGKFAQTANPDFFAIHQKFDRRAFGQYRPLTKKTFFANQKLKITVK